MTIFSVEAKADRQIIGRVHRGRQLREALHEVVDEHRIKSGWINALGAFEWIEVTEYCQTTKRYEEGHRFEACELLSLQGNVSEREGEPFWHVHATVSRRENGKEVVYGGHVLDGVVFALEFRIDCFDGLVLPRTLDDATGLGLWSAVGDGGGLAASPTPPPSAWAMAAQASAGASVDVEEIPQPVKGEWLDHPKFGVCKIEGLSGDGVCIIKLPNARRKKIQIGALEVLAPRDDGARRIFPVRSRSRA